MLPAILDHLYLTICAHESQVGLSRENDREARRRGAPLAHWVFPLQSVGWKPEVGSLLSQSTRL